MNFGAIAQKIAGAGAGSLAAVFLNAKLLQSLDDKIKPFVPLALGAFLPTLMKGELIQNVAAGMFAKGVEQALNVYVPEIYDQIAVPAAVGYVPTYTTSTAQHIAALPLSNLAEDEVLIDEETGQVYDVQDGVLMNIGEKSRVDGVKKDLSDDVI